MKHFIRTAVVGLFFLIGFKPGFTQTSVIISGKITNPTSDSIFIAKGYDKVLGQVPLEDDGSFRFSMDLEKGYYYLSDENEQTRLYISPGDSLHVTINTEEFDESIKYSGKGAKFNNYLVQRYLLRESYQELNQMPYYLGLDEEGFVRLVDSLYTLNMALLEKHNIPDDLRFIEINANKYEKLRKLDEFEPLKRYMTRNDSFRVSDEFPDPYEELELDDDRLPQVPDYLEVASGYFSQKAVDMIKANKALESQFYYIYLDLVSKEVPSAVIRDELAFLWVKIRLSSIKNLDSAYAKAKPLLTKDGHRDDAKDYYQKLKRVQPGETSASFEFKDTSGSKFTLEHFRGKLVYIDVWATWCGPCIGEIPHLRKVEEKYHDKGIAFVSICKSDAHDRWLNYLRSHELSGTQLFAEQDQTDFFDRYMIRGIPHFILLDEKGKIISGDAYRPSDPRLTEQLDALLEK